jgi:hypothetical protein
MPQKNLKDAFAVAERNRKLAFTSAEKILSV